MGYNGWPKRIYQLAAVVGGRVGKLHEMFRLMDDTYRIYIREPTHNPPRVHLYRTGNNGMRAILEIETQAIIVQGPFKDWEIRYVQEYIAKRKAHLLRVCAEILEQQ